VTLDLGSVRADDFAPHVESTFAVTAPAGEDFAITLVDVCRGAGGATREQFTLTFAGGPSPAVRQGTLRLVHDVLGELELFVVPIGPGGDGRPRYEAVFA
jgi:hypothetical protein